MIQIYKTQSKTYYSLGTVEDRFASIIFDEYSTYGIHFWLQDINHLFYLRPSIMRIHKTRATCKLELKKLFDAAISGFIL
jgi:hypothetical protein